MGVRNAMMNCEEQWALSHEVDALATGKLEGPARLYGAKEIVGPITDK
jgi:hypothetical protein